MKALRRLVGSMTGRLFVVLFLGTAVAGLVALSIADIAFQRELSRFQLERVGDRIEAVAADLKATGADSVGSGGGGLGPPLPGGQEFARDHALERIVQSRLPDGWSVQARRGASEVCRPPGPQRREPDTGRLREEATRAQALGLPRPVCWDVQFERPSAAPVAFSVGAPPSAARGRVADPLFLLGLVVLTALLSWAVARLTARPLARLARAAEALRDDLNAPPMPETGPGEVIQAAAALNSLQARLNAALEERSQILAAITHDLQTPLTRLRLRVEKVGDGDLKARLLGDLGATQALIREGLELARNRPSDEPLEALALDTLLASIADDEADAGRPVTFTRGCGCDVQVRPTALRRCLANLIDNAVIHGGGAEISAHRVGERVVIHIDDEGPGIGADDLDRVLEPFTRLEASRSRETGGTGLGLTIAARLAAETGGRLELVRRDKGLSARVHVNA